MRAWRSPFAQAARKVWETLCSSLVGHLPPLGGMGAAGHLGAGPFGQLTAGRRRLAKDLRDLVEGELEDVVQYEGNAFGGTEPLQQDQQSFAHFLVQGHAVRGIDHCLLAEAERTVQPRSIARPFPPVLRGPDPVQAEPARHHGQPAARVPHLAGFDQVQA